MDEQEEPVASTSSAGEPSRTQTQRKGQGITSSENKKARVIPEKCEYCGAPRGEYHNRWGDVGKCPDDIIGDCKICGGPLGFVEGSETRCDDSICKNPYKAGSVRSVLTSAAKVMDYDWITAITDKEGNLRSEYGVTGARLAIITGVDGRKHGYPVRDQKFYETDMGQVRAKFNLKDLAEKNNIKIECFNLGKIVEAINKMKSTSSVAACPEVLEFVNQLRKFNPTIAVHAYCWSYNSILNWVLLSKGLYAELNIRFDLSIITGGRCITMDQAQKDIIHEVVKTRPGILFLWGSSGTGKTLVAVQAVLSLVAYYELHGHAWRLFVCVPARASQLKTEFEEKYFSSLPPIRERDYVTFITLEDLTKEHKVRLGEENHVTPSAINALTTAISEKYPHEKNILMIDELLGTVDKNGIMDFSSLEVRKATHLAMALSPDATNESEQKYNVRAPQGQQNLARQLTTPYRYASVVLNFLQYWYHHSIPTSHQYVYKHWGGKTKARLSTDNDKRPNSSEIPFGMIPTWVEGGVKISPIDMLKTVKKIVTNMKDAARVSAKVGAKSKEEGGEDWKFLLPENAFDSVTVLYYDKEKDEEMFCKEEGWHYMDARSFCGCEDKVVVLLQNSLSLSNNWGTLFSEELSRARSKFFLCTASIHDDEKLFLTEMMDHSEEGKKCDSHTGPCPFVGKHLMAKIELQRKGHPLTDASPVNWAQWVTPKESQLYRIIELSDNDQEEDKYFIKFCSMDKVKINK